MTDRERRLTWAVAVLGLFGTIYGLRWRSQVASESSIKPTSSEATRLVPVPRSTSPPRVLDVAPRVPTAVFNGVPKLEPSKVVARPPGEWQGMPIDLARQAACDTTDRC